MRIIFLDPHLNTCWKNIFHFFRKDKSYSKYGYLIEYALKNKIDIWFYIENSVWLYKYLFYIFIYIWCLWNWYNFFKIRILFKKEELKKDDVLFCFIFKILESKIIKEFNWKKIIHTTHYWLNTEKIAELLKTINNFIFVWENNLIKNSQYFQKYFWFYKDEFYVLPFTYQSRFKKIINFSLRKNKALAIWTLQKSLKDTYWIKAKNIIDFLWEDVSWHHMRKTIYENSKNIMSEIDSYIYDAKDRDKYLLFDVVKLFNDYKMFIVPEEIFNIPWISMIEWIACWSVYIWKKDVMYDEIGMIDWNHYISYDWSLKNLIEKIQYYQLNNTELEKIAENWYNFIISNFNKTFIAKKFYDYFLK